jgi:hypothetical protein
MENTLINNMLQMKEDIGKIAEIVKKHDSETFPKIENTLLRMESKQNKDIIQFHQSREELSKRMDPIEKDFQDRVIQRKENQLEIKRLKWAVITMGTLGVTTAAWEHIVEFFKSIIK